MKNFKRYIWVLLLVVFIAPSVALASWWNPFTWFSNWSFKKTDSVVEQQTEIQKQEQVNKNDTVNSDNSKIYKNKELDGGKEEIKKDENKIFIDNWKTYVNTDYGFSFKYPQDWDIPTGLVVDGKIFELYSKNSIITPFVSYYIINGDLAYDAFVKGPWGHKSTDVPVKIKVDGLDAIKFSYKTNIDGKGNSLPLFNQQVGFKDDKGGFFLINFAVSATEEKAGVDTLNKIISTFTIKSPVVYTDTNILKLKSCGVSLSKHSNWNIVSQTINEIKLGLESDTHTSFAGIDIKCILDNKFTDTDAKFGNITYYYDSVSNKWMVNLPNKNDRGALSAVIAVPDFYVNDFPVFRGTARWLSYIVPISSNSILYFNEGDAEGGYTQTLTNLVKTLKKL